jgi:hypothetical protein
MLDHGSKIHQIEIHLPDTSEGGHKALDEILNPT